MDEWLAQAARTLGLDEGALGARERETLLELARVAAHESGDRRNAPLLCFLLGLAVGRGASLDVLADAVGRSTS